MADCLLLTKTDLVAVDVIDALSARLRALNPSALIRHVVDGNVGSDELLGTQAYDPLCKSADVSAWLSDERNSESHHQGHDHHDVNRHGERIRANCIVLDEPVGEVAFFHWLDLIASMRGECLLRVKGLVNLAEYPEEPLVVHGVQHVFHSPQRLPSWPSVDKRTRIVFITQDIDYAEIARTFQKFVGVRPATLLHL
jgi:G3E family GTPase